MIPKIFEIKSYQEISIWSNENGEAVEEKRFLE